MKHKHIDNTLLSISIAGNVVKLNFLNNSTAVAHSGAECVSALVTNLQTHTLLTNDYHMLFIKFQQ